MKKGINKGIRRRWMVNSIGMVFFVLLLAVTAFSAFVGNYYYNSICSAMQTRATAVSDFFSNYATSEQVYLEMANYYINDFDKQESLELQFINTSGQIVLSSYGLTSGGSPDTADITSAIKQQEVSSWSGQNPATGERIMAVSCPIFYGEEIKGVVRLVSSLELVDHQFLLLILIALGVSLAAVTMVYVTNLYFIRSIVEPMASITETAKRIAAGSYGSRSSRNTMMRSESWPPPSTRCPRRSARTTRCRPSSSPPSPTSCAPLTAINGWSETLLSGEVTDPESIQKGLSIVVSEGHRLSKMVEELLEFSRIEDGRFTLNVEPVDIQAEFEDAIFTYRQLYRKKHIRLDYHPCEEEFPPIPGDPQRLRQVFSNLLDNAAKHGGSDQVIEVGLEREGDAVVIFIRDHGPGVAEKDLPHVKEKFYKGSSKARGSGLGLSVCDENIPRLHGQLTTANAEGGVCIVTIRLPMLNPTVQEP